MSNRRTRWFPPDVLPARDGWYERRWGTTIKRDYWDGQRWYIGTPRGDKIYTPSAPWLPWRGRTEP